MASEEDTKDDITEVKDKEEETTENNDAATSDAKESKEEKSDDKKTDEKEGTGEKEVKLYVGNLPDHCRRTSLQELFEKYGKVAQCDIVKNFAFVVSLVIFSGIHVVIVTTLDNFSWKTCKNLKL